MEELEEGEQNRGKEGRRGRIEGVAHFWHLYIPAVPILATHWHHP